MNQTVRKCTCWVMLVAGLALLGPTTALAAKKVLRIRLDGPVMEAPSQETRIFALLSGQDTKTLYEWLRTIERAAEDDEIAGIAMIIEQPQMSLAQAEEFIRALHLFRKTGKPVYCYIDYAGNLSYMLASAADHITLADTSVLYITGLSAGMTFYKGLFDKIGVEADMLHCGAYKSGVEPYTRTEPSKEAAENLNRWLDGIFERWVQVMAEARGLSTDEMLAAIDAAPLTAEQALQLRLIDEVSSFPAFKQRIRKEFGQDVEILKKLKRDDGLDIDFKNPFAIFELFGKLLEKADEPKKDGLAVLYIEGMIIPGKSEANPFIGAIAGSSTIRAAFEQAREDDKIKAIVVRVNSPGGSGLASDIVWEAATRFGKEKPLVVSMGGVAASGGYYVAIPGDLIFAEEATLTGSIGVFGGKLVWRELWEDKLGITTTEFSRGKHAGLMSMNCPWTDAEREFVQDFLDSFYTQFKDRVMDSRGERIKGDLEESAAGRVYTGRQALERGLVDKIGGLRDAMEYVAKKANLGDDYEVYMLPEAKDPFEQLFANLLGQDTEDEFEMSLRVSQVSDPLLHAALPLLHQLAPRQARTIMRDLRHLVILNREHVGCFLPSVPDVR